MHLDNDGNTTMFHIHGAGLLISRMVNEFGIKRVGAAIEDTYNAPDRNDNDGRR